MKHASSKVGSAWKEPNAEDPKKHHFGAQLDMGGMLPALTCRIVENGKRENEKAPTHLVFFTPPEGGEDRMVGSFWPHNGYLIGRLYPQRFGLARMRGGSVADFRLVSEEIGVKLCALKERKSDRSPTHILLRLTPKPRAAASGAEQEPTEVQQIPVEDLDEALEEEEAVFEEP